MSIDLDSVAGEDAAAVRAYAKANSFKPFDAWQNWKTADEFVKNHFRKVAAKGAVK